MLESSAHWTTYAKQEKRLNSFHLRSVRRILCISWKDKVPNTETLSPAGLSTLYTLIMQRRLRWLGHVYRMEDGRIPKDLLYGHLASGKRATGRPQLRCKAICKRGKQAIAIDTDTWEDLAADRSRWRCILTYYLKSGEKRLLSAAEEKLPRRKERRNSSNNTETHKCDLCDRDCYSRIGLFSHQRSCSSRLTTK